MFLIIFSDIEAKGLQIQLEQTLTKEISPFSSLPRTSGKLKSKSKHRRSPYNHSAEILDFQTDISDRHLEYVTDPSGELLGSNPSLMLPAINDGTIYSPVYPQTIISDIFQYQSPHRFMDDRLQYKYVETDDKYLTTKALDLFSAFSPQNGHASPRLAHLDRHTGSPQFDFRTCSRSSSRDATFGTPQGYLCPFSNRSESSASDVDVVNEDVEKGATDDISIKFHSILDSNSVISKDDSCDSTKRIADPLKHTSPTYRTAPGQLSVIRRSSTTNYQSHQNGGEDYQVADSVGTSAARQQAADQSKHLPISESVTSGETVGETVAIVGDSNIQQTNHSEECNEGHEVMNVQTDVEKPVGAIYSQCLRAACAYNSYNQGGYAIQTPVVHNQRHFPPQQPGYTSVIVDTQQYQMANGYVH